MVQAVTGACITAGLTLFEDRPVVKILKFFVPDGQCGSAIMIEKKESFQKRFEIDLVSDHIDLGIDDKEITLIPFKSASAAFFKNRRLLRQRFG